MARNTTYLTHKQRLREPVRREQDTEGMVFLAEQMIEDGQAIKEALERGKFDTAMNRLMRLEKRIPRMEKAISTIDVGKRKSLKNRIPADVQEALEEMGYGSYIDAIVDDTIADNIISRMIGDLEGSGYEDEAYALDNWFNGYDW